MKRHESQIKELVDFLASLEGRRYPVGVVCYSRLDYPNVVGQPAAGQAGARYLEIAAELLPLTVQPDFFPTLGAYGPDDLAKWLGEAAREQAHPSLVIAQAEPLLATFSQGQVVRLFQTLGRLELRKAAAFLTYLTEQVEEAKYPEDRLLLV